MALTNRTPFSDVCIDDEGNALEDIQVQIIGPNTGSGVGDIFNASNTSLTTQVFSAPSGGSTTGQIITGITGLVEFWAVQGIYRIDFHDTIVPARILDRSMYWSAVPTDVTGTGIDPRTLNLAKISPSSGDIAASIAGAAIDLNLKDNTVHNDNLGLTFPSQLANAADYSNLGAASWHPVCNMASGLLPPGEYLFIGIVTVSGIDDGNAITGTINYDELINVKMRLTIPSVISAEIGRSTCFTRRPIETTTIIGMASATVNGSVGATLEVQPDANAIDIKNTPVNLCKLIAIPKT